MTPADQPPTVSPATLGSQLGAILDHRGVQTAFGLWILGYGVVLWLAHGSLPFDRPAVAMLPFAMQLAAPSLTMLEIFVLMALTFWVAS